MSSLFSVTCCYSLIILLCSFFLFWKLPMVHLCPQSIPETLAVSFRLNLAQCSALPCWSLPRKVFPSMMQTRTLLPGAISKHVSSYHTLVPIFSVVAFFFRWAPDTWIQGPLWAPLLYFSICSLTLLFYLSELFAGHWLCHACMHIGPYTWIS